MMRGILFTLVFAILAANAGNATDIQNLTNLERQAFRTEVRNFLMENPEILMDLIQELENRELLTAAELADSDLIASNTIEIFSDNHSWVGGNKDGDVTLVEFIDYRCGYCRAAYKDVEEFVAADGDIRYVIKELPILGEQSEISARMAVAILNQAGSGTYKIAHDKLISYNGTVNPDFVREFARNEGIDAERLIQDMNSQETTEVLVANFELATRLGINGTPAFIIGDQIIRGKIPLSEMRNLAELARAASE